MAGKITALYRYPEKKSPYIEEQTLILKKDRGIQGDCHADGGERQISLLTVAEKNWMEAQEEKGFCFKKYKPNLLLEDVCLQECKPGDRLKCGEAEIELTGRMKSCYPELCKLASSDAACILAGSVRFARVIKEGIISKDMEVFCYEVIGDEL